MKETIPGHDGELTIVKAFEDILISGDKLGHVRIWRLRDTKVRACSLRLDAFDKYFNWAVDLFAQLASAQRTYIRSGYLPKLNIDGFF